MDDLESFIHDDRGRLFIPGLLNSSASMPVAVSMADGTDILNHGGRKIVNGIANNLGRTAYCVRFAILIVVCNAAPQAHQPGFLCRSCSELAMLDERISPIRRNHVAAIPKGYSGEGGPSTRAAARKIARRSGPSVLPSVAQVARHLRMAVTACEALADLPSVDSRVRVVLPRVPKTLGPRLPCRPAPLIASFNAVRLWLGFHFGLTGAGQVIRDPLRDYSTRANALEDSGDSGALLLGQGLEGEFERQSYHTIEFVFGRCKTRNYPAAIVSLHDSVDSSHKRGTFKAAHPSKTFEPRSGETWHGHLDCDDAEAQTTSDEEAARLQSLQYDFRFVGRMTAPFRQVGRTHAREPANALCFYTGGLRSASRRRSDGDFTVRGST